MVRYRLRSDAGPEGVPVHLVRRRGTDNGMLRPACPGLMTTIPVEKVRLALLNATSNAVELGSVSRLGVLAGLAQNSTTDKRRSRVAEAG